MKLRDKLRIEHPECIGDIWYGGCKDCPHKYGYKDTAKDGECDSKTVNDEICRKCWDREYEGELTPQEKKIEELEILTSKQAEELSRYAGLEKRLKNRVRDLDKKLWDTKSEHYDDLARADRLRRDIREFANRVEKNTNIYIPAFNGQYMIKAIESAFDFTLGQRNRWRFVAITFIIAWLILAACLIFR